jgi:hypothetical protein
MTHANTPMRQRNRSPPKIVTSGGLAICMDWKAIRM